MVRTPIDDIAGTGATVPLTTDRSLISRGWVQLVATGGDCRVGDSTAAVNRGIPVTDGSGVFLPGASNYVADAYTLADIYVYIPNGAKISVAYQE